MDADPAATISTTPTSTSSASATATSTPSAPTALEPFVVLFTLLASINWSWWFSSLTTLLALPFKLIVTPLQWVFGVVLGVLAPVLHILGYMLSWVGAVFSVLQSLEPLYTFFGVAATMGILAGLVLAISSSAITSYLGMRSSSSSSSSTTSSPQYSRSSSLAARRSYYSRPSSFQHHGNQTANNNKDAYLPSTYDFENEYTYDYDEDDDGEQQQQQYQLESRWAAATSRSSSSMDKSRRKQLGGPSSSRGYDAYSTASHHDAGGDWQWHGESSSPTRRRLASGLLAQTIHEEDDDFSG